MTTNEPGRPVIFAGENPVLNLYSSGGQLVAAASCWRCTYSEHGEGTALVIWVDPVASGLGDAAPHAVYADNAALARMLTTDLNQYFDTFRDRGFAEMEPQPAQFSQHADGRRSHQITCTTGSTTIELTWHEVLDVFQWVSRSTVGARDYQVATVICPSARGSIEVNGTAVAGAVRREEGVFQSSAFLAFAESWVAL